MTQIQVGSKKIDTISEVEYEGNTEKGGGVEPQQILKLINYLFMYIPVYVFIMGFVSFSLLAVYKFLHPERTYPEFVAVAYGVFAVLIFWMYYVVKL